MRVPKLERMTSSAKRPPRLNVNMDMMSSLLGMVTGWSWLISAHSILRWSWVSNCCRFWDWHSVTCVAIGYSEHRWYVLEELVHIGRKMKPPESNPTTLRNVWTLCMTNNHLENISVDGFPWCTAWGLGSPMFGPRVDFCILTTRLQTSQRRLKRDEDSSLHLKLLPKTNTS